MNEADISPEDLLAFWRAAGPDRWWVKDEAFDADIRGRFTRLWQIAHDGHLTSWQSSDEGALALIIVLDQFPRNIFRNDARALSTDAMAREVASRAIAEKCDHRVDPALRPFFYMPLMHSEELTDQERCIALFHQSGDEKNLKYATQHADIIRQFGRFPHRNPVLRREMTPEEATFLRNGGFTG